MFSKFILKHKKPQQLLVGVVHKTHTMALQPKTFYFTESITCSATTAAGLAQLEQSHFLLNAALYNTTTIKLTNAVFPNDFNNSLFIFCFLIYNKFVRQAIQLTLYRISQLITDSSFQTMNLSFLHLSILLLILYPSFILLFVHHHLNLIMLHLQRHLQILFRLFLYHNH